MKYIYFLIRTISNFLIIIKYSYISKNFFKSKFFINFIKKNPNTWKKIKISDEYIACDCTNYNPMNLMINLVNGKYLQKIYGCKLLVIDNFPNKYRKILYKSFLADEIICIYSFKDLINFSNFKQFSTIDMPTDLKTYINTKFNFFQIGKVSYDMYLRKSFSGTVNKINNSMYFELFHSVSICNKIQKLLNKFDIKAYTTHEIQFNPESYLLQYFLYNNISVFCKTIGQTSIGIRKYNKFFDSFTPRQNITKNLFLNVKKKFPEKSQLGKKIIEDRFNMIKNKNEDLPDTKFAFKKTQLNISKKELCKKYNWDDKKPIILVLANNIYDGVFEKRSSIFMDNYSWLKTSLELLTQNKNINILVKKHPTENSVPGIKDKTKNLVYSLEQNKNIKNYPDNLSPNSIKDYIDVVFTENGTAGMEYSNYGIPVVTSSNSRYSCANFTKECKSFDEYKNLIQNIEKMNKLTHEQVENSRIFVFINQILTRVDFPLNPKIDTFDKNFDHSFWRILSERIDNFDFESSEFFTMLKKMIKNNNYNLINFRELN